MTGGPPRAAGGGGTGGLPLILCYHKIERRVELGVTRLSPRRFERQIARLARAGWRTLDLAALGEVARGARAAGPRDLVITFDDAYRGLRANAFPVLESHGMGAVCFVITAYAGALNRWDVAYGGRRFAHLAWRDMERWQDRGIEFASHTATHPRLPWLTEREARRELADSRLALRSRLGVRHDAISFPFGAAGERERTLAREEGYTLGFGLAGRWHGCALALPRLPVYPWSPPTPGTGWLRGAERVAAVATNRCAIGTSLWMRARGRASASDEVAPDDRQQRGMLYERCREDPA